MVGRDGIASRVFVTAHSAVVLALSISLAVAVPLVSTALAETAARVDAGEPAVPKDAADPAEKKDTTPLADLSLEQLTAMPVRLSEPITTISRVE